MIRLPLKKAVVITASVAKPGKILPKGHSRHNDRRARLCGLWAGFFSGLFVDLFFGSVFGFYALIYMYIGYLSGYAHRIYYDDDVKVPMFLTAIADLLYNLSVYGLQFLLRGRLGLGTYLYRIIIPEMFYTVFITLIVYRIFRYINYHYMNITRKESESIWVLK